jgi:hypothetical protein
MIKTDGRPTYAWADPPAQKSKRDTCDRPPASELKKLSTDRDLARSC